MAWCQSAGPGQEHVTKTGNHSRPLGEGQTEGWGLRRAEHTPRGDSASHSAPARVRDRSGPWGCAFAGVPGPHSEGLELMLHCCYLDIIGKWDKGILILHWALQTECFVQRSLGHAFSSQDCTCQPHRPQDIYYS